MIHILIHLIHITVQAAREDIYFRFLVKEWVDLWVARIIAITLCGVIPVGIAVYFGNWN